MRVASPLLAAVSAALLVASGPYPSDAREAVDLELALGVDVSGSIDAEEALLQRQGYIAAFSHPQVIDAIRYGPLGRIAVAYYEWAGFGHMKIIADWTVVHDKASADVFVEKLRNPPPQRAHRTAISDAIEFAVPFFDRNNFDGARRVLDLSGDGANNFGRLVTEARDVAVAEGITINGLPIVNNRPSRYGGPAIPDLDLYYEDCVIGGPGAFIVVARDFVDFATAVRRKLILEIAGLQPAPRPRSEPVSSAGLVPIQARSAPPCDIGERMRRYRDDY